MIIDTQQYFALMNKTTGKFVYLNAYGVGGEFVELDLPRADLPFAPNLASAELELKWAERRVEEMIAHYRISENVDRLKNAVLIIVRVGDIRKIVITDITETYQR